MNGHVGTGKPAPGPPRPAMCPACSKAYLAWLDYRLPPPPIRLMSIEGGNPVREIQYRQQRRFEEWRDTIRFQQDLIRSGCPGPDHANVPGGDG